MVMENTITLVAEVLLTGSSGKMPSQQRHGLIRGDNGGLKLLVS